MTEDRWCECGMATNDPMHEGWHKLAWWNEYVQWRAAQQRQAAFDKELEAHDYRHGRVISDPQTALDVSGAVTTAHRANA